MVVRTAEEFQALQDVLVQPGSAWRRLRAVARFLLDRDLLDPNLEPYLLELAGRAPHLVQALVPVGIEPAELEGLLALLAGFQSRVDEIAYGDGALKAAVDELREKCALAYAFTGDNPAAACVLSVDEAVPDWSVEAGNGRAQDPHESLERVIVRARESASTLLPALANVKKRWDTLAAGDEHSAVVPVVERATAYDGAARHLPGLRRISVRIFGERAGEDEVHTDVAVFGAADASGMVFSSAVGAARRLLAERRMPVEKRGFVGQVGFELVGAMHEGSSANLAVAALFYCAVLRHLDRRDLCRIASDTAMTGDVDPGGAVLPVDEPTLEVKVRAAFFSWMRFLVVPAGQREAAERAVQTLQSAHPGRHLEVIGVRRLADLFHDRRVVVDVHQGRVRHFARRVWRRRLPITATVGAALAIVLVLDLISTIDHNPVTAEMVGPTLVVKNRNGAEIDRIFVGDDSSLRAVSTNYSTLYDIDGDGRNEILWAQAAADREDGIAMVHYQEAGAGQPAWSAPLVADLEFPVEPEGMERVFLFAGMKVGDFDADGRPEVVVLALHNTLFPALVIKLDARTGERLGAYVHAGHLYGMTALDLDGDGIQELLFTGANNSYRQAALLVLDPRLISGHAPADSAYRPTGWSPAAEAYYIRIPQTAAARSLRYRTYPPCGRIFETPPGTRRVIVTSDDMYLAEGSDLQRIRAYLLLHFNYRLEPIGVSTSSEWDLLTHWLAQEGLIDEVPDQQYFDSFMKEFLYWDGSGWRNEPTRNARWAEAVDTLAGR